MFDWIPGLIRSLMLMLDRVVYWAVTTMYELFLMIARTGIFTQETLQDFAGRIYALLGVFMLFKVTFSLVQYIFNPEDFSDKTKGPSKLLTNFFIVLIGIIAVPYVFTAAYDLQKIVLEKNVLANLVLGMRSTTTSDQATNTIKQGGNNMAYTVFSAFFRPNEKIAGTDVASGKECAENPILVNGDTAVLNPVCNSPLFDEILDNNKSIGDTLVEAYNQKNHRILMDTDLVNYRYKDEDWAIDYTFLIPTLAGGFLAWMLLGFCIDLAVRSVKLGFLQLIAPIPIISYIDPKSGKDGTFNKWLKNCTSTYLDVFIRVLAIYFALFIITAITSAEVIDVTTGAPQGNWVVKIFILFGALLFAKQVPELISDLTGQKTPGKLNLNPMKKLGEAPLASAAVGGALGLAGGVAANTWALGKNIKDNVKEDGWKVGLKKSFVNKNPKTGNYHTGIRAGFDVIGNAFTGVAGGFSAGARGIHAGLNSDGKGSALKAATKGITESSKARRARDQGFSLKDRIYNKATDIAGIEFNSGTTDINKDKIKENRVKIDNYKRDENAAAYALQQLATRNNAQDYGQFAEAFKVKKAETQKDGTVKYTFEHADFATFENAWKAAHGGAAPTINRADYDAYKGILEARNHADNEARKLEKVNTKLSSATDTFTGRNRNN